MTGSSDMLTDLAKMLNLLAVVVPHQKFAFHDTCMLEFALWSADGQTCHNSSVENSEIERGLAAENENAVV